jgi:phenylpropionate dioxygenase-like ring-hydroxylating dioxygenase large terminal subunit
MSYKNYWYVVCESRELKSNSVLSRQVLDEWLAVYRGEDGKPCVLRDRCAHRAGKLSNGKVKDGRLTCNYHGWTYDGVGQVARIPSDSPEDITTRRRCAKVFAVIEQDGYVYTRLAEASETTPFKMPKRGEPGYHTIRLQHRFENNVTNCVENFVDIPHTTFVHPGIFRYDRRQKLTANVIRSHGSVRAEYGQETNNFGIFSKVLNFKGSEIRHIDEFHMPNVTSVHYHFGKKKHFIITSQSVPVSDEHTLVYTDLTYNYGWWSQIARPFIYLQAKAIIRQDVKILREQMEVIRKYGMEFQNSRSDIIHTYIESIREEIAVGRDPRALPEKKTEIEFWI